MVDADVIIVGAGPAGSTTARYLSREGLDVILVDKESFPRTKPCAGGIRNKVTTMLDFDYTKVLQRKISGFAIFSPKGLRIDAIPEDRSKPGYMIMREEFDTLLLEKAREAGARVYENFKVVEATQDIESVQIKEATGEKLTAKILVGADGINSIIARKIGFYKGWKNRDACVAIEVEATLDSKKIDEICADTTGYNASLFFLNFGPVPYGYTWVFPKRNHLSLGICCRQDLTKNLRATFDRWFVKFKESWDIEPEIFAESSARFPIKAVSNPVIGRTMLIGDAAGFVDAFTGEGIPYAIESGILAAKTITEAIKKNDIKRIPRYGNLCKKTILRELRVTESMAKMFYKRPQNMETLCKFFYEDKYARYLIAASIAGLLPMSTVKRKMTLRMMRTRPRAALSLL